MIRLGKEVLRRVVFGYGLFVELRRRMLLGRCLICFWVLLWFSRRTGSRMMLVCLLVLLLRIVNRMCRSSWATLILRLELRVSLIVFVLGMVGITIIRLVRIVVRLKKRSLTRFGLLLLFMSMVILLFGTRLRRLGLALIACLLLGL